MRILTVLPERQRDVGPHGIFDVEWVILVIHLSTILDDKAEADVVEDMMSGVEGDDVAKGIVSGVGYDPS